MTEKSINERIAILETVYPEFREAIKVMAHKQTGIEIMVNKTALAINSIKIKVENQYNWSDKWKLMLSGIGIAGGIISVVIGIAIYLK